MSTQAANISPRPPAITVGYLGWLRANLFSSPWNAVTTVALGTLIVFVGLSFLQWVMFTADWEVVTSRTPLYLVGAYPRDEFWRPLVSVLLVSGLMGMSWRMWGGIARVIAIAFGVTTLIVAVLPISMPILNRVLILINPSAIAIGYGLTFLPAFARPKSFAIGAAAVFLVSLLVIKGVPGVPGLEPVNAQNIGGLMLNLLLAVFGIVCSMPIGIALALGRRSSLPVVKIVCVGFIEIVRGVPLITLLFMSRHILPLMLPENVHFNELNLAAVTITLFSSAYMAENVRGGMASVPPGQSEAARALGLRAWQTTIFVTLPQGLRNIIPAIVGQFISLFKDTSLVFFIGMLDLVEMGRVTIQGNLEFNDNGREIYLFIAAVFWVFTYSMSYVSRRIERALGVGRR